MEVAKHQQTASAEATMNWGLPGKPEGPQAGAAGGLFAVTPLATFATPFGAPAKHPQWFMVRTGYHVSAEHRTFGNTTECPQSTAPSLGLQHATEFGTAMFNLVWQHRILQKKISVNCRSAEKQDFSLGRRFAKKKTRSQAISSDSRSRNYAGIEQDHADSKVDSDGFDSRSARSFQNWKLFWLPWAYSVFATQYSHANW